MTDDIRALKTKRCKNEVIWRKNPLFVNFEIVALRFNAIYKVRIYIYEMIKAK